MLMNIEIELRYHLLAVKQIPDFVKQFHFLGTKRVVDCYLDTQDADLAKAGLYIRIRNNQKLDIKFNRACLLDKTLSIQDYCEEYSFVLPLSQAELPRLNQLHKELNLATVNSTDLEQYKQQNNLIEHRIVDKMRSTYSHENFTIVIDEVKDLGKFLEIESMAHNTNTLDEVKKQMADLVKNLSLKPLKTGYDALLLRKQNFQLYLQSRFALQEDLEAVQNN
jgi:adenylate cyclase, class 2